MGEERAGPRDGALEGAESAARSEFALIQSVARVLRRKRDDVVVGHGDDGAVVRPRGDVVVVVDAIVEGVHFERAWSRPGDVGWKALAVNVSDVAAMGAVPTVAVVAMTVPADLAHADVVACAEGMAEACDAYDVAVVGGDTVTGPVWALAVTMLGEVDRAVTRAGARAGDAVVVVGALGAAAAAVRTLVAGGRPDEPLLAAHRRPRALPAAGRILAQAGATAMIDVSDGLGADLAHLARASKVDVELRAADLPVAAGVPAADWELVCGGGEDFALVATLPPAVAGQAAVAAGRAEDVPAAVVGSVVAGHAQRTTRGRVRLLLPDGGSLAIDRLGYDHGS